MDKPLDVVIVGGSLSGLMSGIVLKRLGHNVHILNRDPSSSLQGQGAGISAMQDVQDFLSNYDLSKQPYSIPSPNVQFLNRKSELIKTRNIAVTLTSWNVLYYRLRANFDGLLSEYCPEIPTGSDIGEGKATYDPGKNVTDVKYEDGFVTVFFDSSEGGSGSLHADLVIAADGPGSKIRQILQPELQRKYAGYVAWRGTAYEGDVSAETRKAFGGKMSYYQMPRGHILMYTIPGQNGSLQPGQRLLNYVWYCNHAAESADLADIMTDTDGHRHRITVPMGKLRPDLWARQQALAAAILPAPFAELVDKTALPFIQAITDIDSPRAAFFDGKLLLVGDALATFRPHIGRSTNQAALQARLLGKLVRREMGVGEWEREVLAYAKVTGRMSVLWGNLNQFGYWGAVGSAVSFGQAWVEQWLRKWWYG